MDQSALSGSFKPPLDLPLTPVAGLAWLKGNRFWLLFLVIIGLLGLLIAVQSQTSGALHFLLSDASPALALLSAFIGSFWVSLRLPKGKNRLAWRWISLAFLSYFIAETIEASIVVITGFNPIPPSLADLFILLFYPCLITGLLFLPSPSLSRGARGRLIVDAGMIACAALGVSLLTIVMPLLDSTESISGIEKVIVSAYPLGDVALAATLLLLLIRATEGVLRPILLWMFIGACSLLCADAAFNIIALKNISIDSSPIVDPFTVAGEFLMGLSAWFYLIHGNEPDFAWLWLARSRKTTVRTLQRPWYQRYLLPYLPLALVVFLGLTRDLLPPSQYQLVTIFQILALFTVVMTITRQILLNAELVDAKIANEQAQQLDALKDQFITSINHELRTPLMTMQTYIELLRYQQQTLPEKTGRLVTEIGRTNDALVDLVQSILEVRRIDQKNDEFPREVVHLQHAWEQALALINPREGSIAERILRVNLQPDLAIWGESVRVQQILTNLLSNAVKYSPPRSVIEVSARTVQTEGGRRSKAGKQQMVEIQVRDYGLGIPPEQIPLLFHRFVRLPRDLASNVVGSGLGLYLCQVLTEAMGGHIWVESAGVPGQGSTFALRLPSAEAVTNQQPIGETMEAHIGW